MVLGRKNGHGQLMTPVDVEVIRSKVKVTVPFNEKTCPLNILKSLCVTVILHDMMIGHGQ